MSDNLCFHHARLSFCLHQPYLHHLLSHLYRIRLVVVEARTHNAGVVWGKPPTIGSELSCSQCIVVAKCLFACSFCMRHNWNTFPRLLPLEAETCENAMISADYGCQHQLFANWEYIWHASASHYSAHLMPQQWFCNCADNTWRSEKFSRGRYEPRWGEAEVISS